MRRPHAEDFWYWGLRTLVLAVMVGILLGLGLAYYTGSPYWLILAAVGLIFGFAG